MIYLRVELFGEINRKHLLFIKYSVIIQSELFLKCPCVSAPLRGVLWAALWKGGFYHEG
jgi:hypothetical protein